MEKLDEFFLGFLAGKSRQRVLRWYEGCPKWLKDSNPIPLLINLAITVEIAEFLWSLLRSLWTDKECYDNY